MMGRRNKSRDGRKSALHGFSQIVSGTIIGQAVTFFALPVLSRLYDPQQFGLLTICLSISALIMPWGLLALDQAVAQAKDDVQVAKLSGSAILTLGIVCILLVPILLVTPIAVGSQNELRVFLAISLPLLVATTGLSSLLQQFSIRQGEYGSIGKRNSVVSISITVFQLVLSGLMGYFWLNGLVLGALLGNLVGVLIMVRFATPYLKRIKVREMVETIREFWRFPLVFAPMTSITQLAQQFPVLFVAYWFTVSESGQLGMAERIATVPASILGLAGASVFVGEFSKIVRKNEANATRIFLRYSVFLGVVAAVVVLAFAMLSTWAIPRFLGEQWVLAAQIMQISALAAGTRILSTTFRRVFMVLNRARLLSIPELVKLGLLFLVAALTIWAELALIVSLTFFYLVLAFSDLLTWALGWYATRAYDASRSNLT